MTQIKIELPNSFNYSIEYNIRLTEVNVGGHLGNDSLIGLMNDAYMKYLETKGFKYSIIDNYSLINTNLVINYLSEVFFDHNILIELCADNYTDAGFDFIYRITNKNTNKIAAVAKAYMLVYDYINKKKVKIPEKLLNVLKSS